MASVPLEMDDIFDAGGGEDFNPDALPSIEDELGPMGDDPHGGDGYDDGGDGDQPITDDPELLAQLANLKGASKTATTKRSMPKLDVTRLTGDRGIPILPRIFEKVPLKGKHHEVEDLKTIMRHLEHWGHRLFPKMPFVEVLDRCERLGAKGPVKTCVKRIRLDMPVLPSECQDDEDDAQRADDDNGDDDVRRAGDHVGDDHRSSNNPDDEIDEDEIEDLLREQAEYDREHNPVSAKVSDKSLPDTQPKKVSTPFAESTMSDDVKARIERNKKLAMERRAARMAAKSSNGSSNVSAKPQQQNNVTDASSNLTKEGEEYQLPESKRTTQLEKLAEALAESDDEIDRIKGTSTKEVESAKPGKGSSKVPADSQEKAVLDESKSTENCQLPERKGTAQLEKLADALAESDDEIDQLKGKSVLEAEIEQVSMKSKLNEEVETSEETLPPSKVIDDDDVQMDEEDYSLRLDDSTDNFEESPLKKVDAEYTLTDDHSKIDFAKSMNALESTALVQVDG